MILEDNHEFAGILRLTEFAFKEISEVFEIEEDIWQKYIINELLLKEELVPLYTKRMNYNNLANIFDTGLPGTILNIFVLYALIRHFNLKKVIETGTANGFTTVFLLEALQKNNGHLVSIELSQDDNIASLVSKEYNNWKLIKGVDSLDFMNKHSLLDVDLFCHDSLHTTKHMLKELFCFKQSNQDLFFVYFDDQDSEMFWKKTLHTKAFKKNNYNVSYISGNESKLCGHIGGFIKYKKI